MESRIATALHCRYSPVAILWKDDKPEGAKEFKPGKWGCVMWMLAAAAKGGKAVFSRSTYGCWGGGVGLGFGNAYLAFPGGMDGFCRFLSSGNACCEAGRAVAEQIKPYVGDAFLEDFLNGEGYVRDPELVRDFLDGMPMVDVPAQYVVFEPLADVDEKVENPEVIVFLVNPDQLSALIVLANYDRKGFENAIAPYAAGCQTIGIFAYREAKNGRGRAVIGMSDISARENIAHQLERGLMTVAIPYGRYLEMEANVAGSFLEKRTWKKLVG
ncbi:DUF169 domain-containing protein [Desulfatirhabdium butyrativorans]|uniref:DUF169 domain-containing protein n=1 Tax=Desulfatirhabdium butyrativorans TaxID=340467 RepID=UPI0004083CCC|nr:DUF169 domain-containing protein [Desulfatirhabdium butyrativorans]